MHLIQVQVPYYYDLKHAWNHDVTLGIETNYKSKRNPGFTITYDRDA